MQYTKERPSNAKTKEALEGYREARQKKSE